MSNTAGWYPDPGGQPGMYRYWTGSAWTEAITPTPQTTPPPPISAYARPDEGTPQGAATRVGAPAGGVGDQYAYPAQKRRSTLGWWLGGLGALAAVLLVATLIIRGLGGSVPGVPDLPGLNPTPTVTPNICPPASTSSPMPTADPNSGTISGGRLSYPALGSPWATGWDNRVPWGALAMVQEVLDQENYDGSGSSWVASILVSDLFVGDGFASTKIASETVLKCVLGKFYADTVVEQDLVSSERHDVDGHAGWLIETQLSFSIPGLNATGERVLLLVVQTGDDDYSLFYASIPDTKSELLPDARRALEQLRVQE